MSARCRRTTPRSVCQQKRRRLTGSPTVGEQVADLHTGFYDMKKDAGGVAAAAATRHEILAAGVAGLVAGARSMAAGEDVSVSSHADTEHADQGRASHSRFRACCVLGRAGYGGDRRRRNVIRNDGRLNHRARWH